MPNDHLNYGPRDFPEDAVKDEDNGAYSNMCRLCQARFIGHKRRNVCKTCTPKFEAHCDAVQMKPGARSLADS